ncbi:hypothetical protein CAUPRSCDRAFT_11520 [Caulochytrium protostelioides]|uniref:Uncharacterized protein n=1 Tax=Caulochytrium protostelioides TaxID=1555241 RepID=A0A4P9WZJ1_9FUNG|nr:hypothetical protein CAUPRSCDRAFT_11520 [Caulochytrium protostelioides]
MDDQRPSSSGTHGPDVLRPHRCIASTVTPSLNDTTRALMRHVLADEYAASLAACRRIQRLEAALALIQPADGLSLSDQSLCRSVGPTETVTITSQVPPNRSDDEAALHILRSRYDLDGLTSLITQLASHDATDNEPESPVSQKVPRFEVADNAAALAARMTAQLQARSDAYVAHRLSATKWPHRRFHGVEPLRHLEPINRPDLGPMLDACRRHVIDERQRDPADVGSPPTWSGRLNKALQTMLTQTTQVNDATLLAQTVTLDYQFGWNRPVAPFATRLLHANGVPDSYLHPRRLSFHQGEVPGRVHPLYESIIAGSESILSAISGR